ncbi:MAG TPA: MFS transporter [Burkholderiales bacterium]|nr:MFS transporter [Burkholderiales bacterium]
MAEIRKSGVHYAWLLLAAAMILNITSRADQGSFGVFIDPLVSEFGWKRGDISFAYSLAFIIGIPAVLIMGWLGDRYGARQLMLFSSLMIGVGTILLGTIKELWHFYVFYAVFVGSTGHAAFSVLLPVIVTRWFYRNLGIVMGIFFAAQGLGPVVFAPLFRWLLETRGWQNSFLLIGTVLVCVLAFFSLFIHRSPADKGLQPYGVGDAPAEPPVAAASSAPSTRLRDYLRLRTVWILIAIHHIGCLSHAVILVHVVSMATFRGIPGVEAAGVLAAIAGASAISRFAFSVLADRFGGRLTLSISLLGQSLPVILLFFATESWHFYLFAVLFGLCYGGEMVGFPIINKQLFGTKAPLGSIYSFQMAAAGIGMAIGGWLGGALFDFAGDYTWALLISLVVGCLGVPLALALPRHGKSPPGSFGQTNPIPTASAPLPASAQHRPA